MKTFNDGAKNLLEEVVSLLSNFDDLEYIIIGGWCPLLRNDVKDIIHPGTLDVDILFKEGYQSGAIIYVIDAFLKQGFMSSAKYQFQLLKQLEINKVKVVFDVDLLHPNMIEDKSWDKKFIDHLDLDVAYSVEKNVKKMSIALPNSMLLFDYKLFNKYNINLNKNLEFNLVDFTGMFITKMESCQKEERQRDSFDIYLAFLNDGIDIKKIYEIVDKNEHIKLALEKFKTYLRNESETFDANVKLFYEKLVDSPAQMILEQLIRKTRCEDE
jgi:hypothetical protein